MADLYPELGTEISFPLLKERDYSRDKAIPHQWVLPANATWIRQPQKYHEAALGAIVEGAGCLVGLPA
jgi:hypothetical protein